MEEEKQEKLPIDARLLSDAIIELNISRRSVGLYPPEHPIVKESIGKAFELLKRLFDLRSSITLGIAKDTLVIDEYVLDRKNPVFREFALSLHSKGIAAVTFYSGLESEELVCLHEVITMHHAPAGKTLVELAEGKGLKHIRLSPLDLHSFGFVEGGIKQGASETRLWDDYIYGLLEGRLADNDAEGVVLAVPPEQAAFIINSSISEDASEETYDRVIAAYLKRKGEHELSKGIFNRFISFVENLRPELKAQFLNRAFSQPPSEMAYIEKMLAELTEEDLRRLFEVFKDRSSIIPESLKNLIDKLALAKGVGKDFFDMVGGEMILVDDIEMDRNMIRLLEEDHFRVFVNKQYERELGMMLERPEAEGRISEISRIDCSEGVIDRTFSEVLIEILESDLINTEDCLRLLTRLSELADSFLETGRFQELCDIFNALYSHWLAGKFKTEALNMIEYFFRSEQFIKKLVDALKLWGRYDREGAIRLARVLKLSLINPLLDALSEESDSTARKFLLSLLSTLGSDVVPEAIKRLNDERWYVLRNMLCLIRQCGGKRSLEQVRKLARDKNKKVCMEAVKTLLHFGTPDALSYLRLYLENRDPEFRQQAIKLAGTYRVKAAVPHLIELLNKNDFLGTETYYKISVVKALAEIGDPRAIAPLERLYRSKRLFYRDALEGLKVEIFRNLHCYPPDAIGQMLELGLNSRNEEIRDISARLSKKDSY